MRHGKSLAVRRHLGLQAGSWFRLTHGPGRRQPLPRALSVDRLLGNDLDLAFPEAPEELLAGAARRRERSRPTARSSTSGSASWTSRAPTRRGSVTRNGCARALSTAGRPVRQFPRLLPVARRAHRDRAEAAPAALLDRLFAAGRARSSAYHRRQPPYAASSGELRQGVASRYLASSAAGADCASRSSRHTASSPPTSTVRSS